MDYQQIKQLATLGMYFLYRLRGIPRIGPYFNKILEASIYPAFLLLFYNNWRTLGTPILYVIMIYWIYWRTKKKTNNLALASLLAYSLPLISGYLYEIPRFLFLEAPVIVHYSNWSPIFFDWAPFCIPFIYLVLINQGWDLTSYYVLGLAGYIFFLTNWALFESLRPMVTFFPSIIIIRLPTMLFMASIPEGLRSRLT